jgi:hypothetical protein
MYKYVYPRLFWRYVVKYNLFSKYYKQFKFRFLIHDAYYHLKYICFLKLPWIVINTPLGILIKHTFFTPLNILQRLLLILVTLVYKFNFKLNIYKNFGTYTKFFINLIVFLIKFFTIALLAIIGYNYCITGKLFELNFMLLLTDGYFYLTTSLIMFLFLLKNFNILNYYEILTVITIIMIADPYYHDVLVDFFGIDFEHNYPKLFLYFAISVSCALSVTYLIHLYTITKFFYLKKKPAVVSMIFIPDDEVEIDDRPPEEVEEESELYEGANYYFQGDIPVYARVYGKLRKARFREYQKLKNTNITFLSYQVEQEIKRIERLMKMYPQFYTRTMENQEPIGTPDLWFNIKSIGYYKWTEYKKLTEFIVTPEQLEEFKDMLPYADADIEIEDNVHAYIDEKDLDDPEFLKMTIFGLKDELILTFPSLAGVRFRKLIKNALKRKKLNDSK